MASKELYELAGRYRECAPQQVFADHEVLAVEMEDGTVCYVTVFEGSLVAFIGTWGLASYFRYVMTDCEGQPLLETELENSFETFVVSFDNNQDDLDEEELEQIASYGLTFAEGTYPRFLYKRRYAVPWAPDATTERSFSRLLQAILFAQTYFAGFGKTSHEVTLNGWLDSLGLEDGDRVDYIPTITYADGSFSVSAQVMPDEVFGIDNPVSSLPDGEYARQIRRMRPKSGKVLYLSTFLFPDPVLSSKGPAPVYPVAMLLYDPQAHQLLDAFLVEDYEAEYDRFVYRLLEYIRANGKPQAIHCFGFRTLPLLKEFGKRCSITMMSGSPNQELEDLKAFFVMQGRSGEGQ